MISYRQNTPKFLYKWDPAEQLNIIFDSIINTTQGSRQHLSKRQGEPCDVERVFTRSATP